MPSTATATVAIDTTSIFLLAEPLEILPTDSWSRRRVDAFSMRHQLGSSTGYEVDLWTRIDGTLTCVARTRKHIKIDGADVTVAFGGKRIVVGTVT